MWKGKRILIISPENWSGNLISKHHYAINLADQGGTVFFLGPNSSPNSNEKVSVLHPPRKVRGLAKLPGGIRRGIMSKQIQQLEKQAGGKFDIVWSFDTSVLYELDLFENALRILHVVDLNQEFQWEIAGRTADLCLGTTRFIVDRLKIANPNTYFIHHGYAPVKLDEDFEFQGDNALNIVYSGNVGIPYIDKRLMHDPHIRYEDMDFHFFGSYSFNQEELAADDDRKFFFEKANCFHYGQVEGGTLQSALKKADLLYLAYGPEHKKQIANPHKVMEYLGSGTPIISSVLLEYEQWSDLIFMTDDVQDYLDNFGVLAKEKVPEKEEARRAIALDNTYLKQLERIERLINADRV